MVVIIMKKLSILVPESVVEYAQVADMVSIEFANKFQGFNQYEGNGGWVDGNGQLVKEKHIRVEAFADMSKLSDIELFELAWSFLQVLKNQDCILVEYDGKGGIVNNHDELIALLDGYRNL